MRPKLRKHRDQMTTCELRAAIAHWRHRLRGRRYCRPSPPQGPAPHQRAPHPGKGAIHAPLEEAISDVLGTPEPPLHSVWGRMVADIPAFCRELVAALTEE